MNPPPFLNFLYRRLISSLARPKRSHQRPVLKNPQSKCLGFLRCCVKNQDCCTVRTACNLKVQTLLHVLGSEEESCTFPQNLDS